MSLNNLLRVVKMFRSLNQYVDKSDVIKETGRLALRPKYYFAGGLVHVLPPQQSVTEKPSNSSLALKIVALTGCVAALALSWYAVKRSKSSRVQYAKSKIISGLKSSPKLKPELLRNSFNDLDFQAFRFPVNHTHPEAAADRSSASLFIDRLSWITGNKSYFVQQSRNDEKLRRAGSRVYYWTKDLNVDPKPLNIPDNALIAMVDVDQYMDMPSFLATVSQPTIIYTFQPDQVAKTTKDYSYTFDEKDQVVYDVSGGGRFLHQVWNYSTDHLVTRKTFLGIPYTTSAYLVDRRRTSPDHELIMFTPLGSWGLLGSIFYKWWMEGRELSRLHVSNSGGFLRLQTNSSSGVKISTGRVNAYMCATIPAVVDDTISAIARTSKYDLTMPQVMSYVEGDRTMSAALLEYHRSTIKEKPDVVCPISQSARHYQFVPMVFDQNAKPMLTAFMTPMMHGAFAPSVCVNNEDECIRARVERPRPATLPITPFLTQVMREFAERFLPEAKKHSLDPTDYDEVLDRQYTPVQRRILSMAESILPKRNIQMFMKREAYANVKAPRPISQINPVDKREYSRYLYALGDLLKDMPWYAFGVTPKLIAKRVVQVLSHADFATNTDFSKFDGHGSNLMREFEKIILTRAFRPQYHEEILELHRSQFGLKAYGAFGTWYETAYSRASGSPETSVFNTIFNAFIAFLALRMSFLGADEAYASLGVYGGDDGLTAGVKKAIYCKAAKAVGQELTIDVVFRGEFGIKFLARVYSSNVWFGDETNCCDVSRQLSKFHVTVNFNQNVTPRMKLLEKVRCLVLTDEHTPILGEFCKAVLTVHGSDIKKNDYLDRMVTWNSRFDKTNQYDNSPGDWMLDYVESALPEFDYKRFKSWLTGANTLEKLLSPPMFVKPVPAKSTEPVVIGDEVLPRGARICSPAVRRPDDISADICSTSAPWKVPKAPAIELKINADKLTDRIRGTQGLKSVIPQNVIEEDKPVSHKQIADKYEQEIMKYDPISTTCKWKKKQRCVLGIGNGGVNPKRGAGTSSKSSSTNWRKA